MSEFLLVAEQVLRRERRPLGAREITDSGFKGGLFSDKLHGRTPWQTMKSKLSQEIRAHGDDSKFVRTAPGRFYLRELTEDPRVIYEAEPWRPPPSRERVVVFPSSLLDQVGSFQGVVTRWRKRYDRLFRRGSCVPMDRAAAELTEDFKQVLTYIVVTRKGKVLAYRRGTYNRVEQMLRGADCVGFGGHIRDDDRSLFSTDDIGVTEAAIRELTEELRLPREDRERLARGEGLEVVGLLNDDSSDVGRRHIAILMRYETGDSAAWDQPVRGEESITRLRWVDPADSKLRLRSFEYWSQLALRALFSGAIRVQASYLVRTRKPFATPHLLVLVGPIGSGKTEAADVLRTSYGYTEVNSGRVLAELLGIPPVPDTSRDEFQILADGFIRQLDGPRRLASALIEATEAHTRDRVLVDGIRQRATLEELRGLRSSTRTPVMYVHTPPDVAFSLYREREEPGIDIRRFLMLRDSPVEAEVASLIDLSDAVLYNWIGVRSYRRTVVDLMRELDVLPRRT